jgi:hypothetical protein
LIRLPSWQVRENRQAPPLASVPVENSGSSQKEFDGDGREAQIMRDTFELFRRESRTIDILTFDELHERAAFILRSD